MKRRIWAAGILLSVFSLGVDWLAAGQLKPAAPHYKVLPPVSQGNLTAFPVVSAILFDAKTFMTLDQGIRSGQVIVTEAGSSAGLVRPRPAHDGVWQERPFPFP